MPELVFLRRGEEVLRFTLDRPRIVLGRGDRCDVVIPDAEVSRHQAAVLLSGDSATVEDLSGKGTVVGGTRAPRAPLIDGAEIALGQWRAIFRAHPAAEATTETEVRGTVAHPNADAGSERWQAAQIRLRHAGTESVHRLVGEGATIGKDSGNDLVLEDRFISGKHLRITRRGGRFLLLDHASTNGTWLGAVRLFEAEVPLHTQVHIGETDVVLEPATTARKDAPPAWQGLVGADPAMKLLIDLIERVAPSSAAVIILGESGTGKELVARAVHARSPRAERPFVPVNCAAISKELIESELFGHEKGAFTGAVGAHKGAFEEADGGTLFLDEIGELPLDLQAKLLRALESGEIKRVGASRPSHVDVRVVAATNRDLLAASRSGQFRDDLYYRLCVVPLTIPPLRNRRGDIPDSPSTSSRSSRRAGRPCGSPRRPSPVWRAIPGRETSASCGTSCTERCCCAAGQPSTRRISPSTRIPPPDCGTGAVSRVSTSRAESSRTSWNSPNDRSSNRPCDSSTTTASGSRRSSVSHARRSSSA